MAKRSKKARSTQKTKAGSRSGSGASRPADAVDPAGPTEDPLALQAWDTPSNSPEEAEERVHFEQAWEAFCRGDFRRCRAEATRLAADAASGEVRRRARSLLDRMRVDPLALAMAAGALALVLLAVVWTFA